MNGFVDFLKKYGAVLIEPLLRNWVTSLAASPAVAVVLLQLSNAIDDNPETVVNFEALAAAVSVVLVGLMAKDGKRGD